MKSKAQQMAEAYARPGGYYTTYVDGDEVVDPTMSEALKLTAFEAGARALLEEIEKMQTDGLGGSVAYIADIKALFEDKQIDNL